MPPSLFKIPLNSDIAVIRTTHSPSKDNNKSVMVLCRSLREFLISIGDALGFVIKLSMKIQLAP